MTGDKKIPKTFVTAYFALAFCLIIAPQGTSYSAYRTRITDMADARVAAFQLELTIPEAVSDNAVLDFNDPEDMVVYRFYVINRSETDVGFQLSVSNVPEGFSVGLSTDSGRLKANGGKTSVKMAIIRRGGTADGFSLDDIEISAEAWQLAPED